MAYYLRHYFDPDFKHEQLIPQITKDGAVTYFYLGYVQNVVAGQVVAELIDLDRHPDATAYDPRFITSEPYFPCGPNCTPHPGKPSRMIATANGYCFYLDGLITVKKLLNVRRDVDFHTGNIMFVGNVIAHEAVRSGFILHGYDMLVKGTVEGAIVRADGSLVCEAGIKGGGSGRLESRGNIKLPFCESIFLQAGGNIEIDGTCMHSSIYTGGSLMVKGRLQGGEIYAKQIVFVQNQLGGGQDTLTRVTLGYSPEKLQLLDEAQKDLDNLQPRLLQLELALNKKPERLPELSLLMRMLNRKINIRHKQIRKLRNELSVEAQNASGCKIICPGNIHPGVEVSIGGIKHVVDDFYSNMEFILLDEEIVMRNLR
ncbi:MAG: FapA family protein [Deltaproteobacteria bacterium]|jgi:uncharacterized protein (DUF342 family)|nr:FapA family protein [Deltaproteobacteria bacterium]